MTVIKQPTLDLNGNVRAFGDYTITNATDYAARNNNRKILAPEFYPYKRQYQPTWGPEAS